MGMNGQKVSLQFVSVSVKRVTSKTQIRLTNSKLEEEHHKVTNQSDINC